MSWSTPPMPKRRLPEDVPEDRRAENRVAGELAVYFEWMKRRVVMISGVLTALFVVIQALGWSIRTPNDELVQTAQRVTTIEMTVRAQATQVQRMSERLDGNLYLSCQILRKISPPGSIPPEQCK